MSIAANIEQSFHWEMLPWRDGMPACEHLKVKGEPYPFGSIIYRGGFANPHFECHAFYCDEAGRAQTLWQETVLETAADAKQAVIQAHTSAFKHAA